MARYRVGRTGNTTSDKLEKSRTIFKVTIVTIILLVPAVIYVIISTLPPNPVTGKSIDKGRFDPTVTFTTDWFTFTAPKSWEEAANLHQKDKMYVYRQKNGGEQLGILRIYINTDTPSYKNYYTRLLPVKVEGTKFVIQTLQPHCKTLLSDGDYKGNPKQVIQADVTFTCWGDNSGFYAVAGEIGGTPAINVTRPNGERATYLITYENTAFTPSEGSFEQVLQSFEAK